MKQFKLIPALVISTSLLSSATFAHVATQGDTLSAVAPVAYNWTGIYVGGNAGIVKYTANITDNQATTFYATIQQAGNPKPVGGFQVGLRRQLNLLQVSGVYGLEFSAHFANVKMTKEYGSPYALYQLKSGNKLKNLGLLQLMGGIAADRTLLFLAAGFSWTNSTSSMANLGGIPYFDEFILNKKVLGTAVSAGVEYAFSEKISARLKVDYILPNSYSTFEKIGNDFQITNNIVLGTIGVNYRFA